MSSLYILSRYLEWVEKKHREVNKYPQPVTKPIYIVDKDEE